MKISGILSSIIFICIAVACTPAVTFDEPQPANTKDLSKFPNRLKGEYVSLSDNSILRISDKLIERVYDFDTKIHRNELDSTMILRNDTIINLETNEKTFVKKMGDSLMAHIFYTDTLFELNADHILRKMKGYCFLNTRYTEQNWEVKKLSLHRGKLTIGSISAESELETLVEITESPKDTIPPYPFTATKKQFKKFVKQEGFTDTETFIKR
jgi:hypothetical protein